MSPAFELNGLRIELLAQGFQITEYEKGWMIKPPPGLGTQTVVFAKNANDRHAYSNLLTRLRSVGFVRRR